MSEIRVNNILNAAGDDAPTFTKGFSVATGMGITGGGNIVATAGTFSGALTGTTGTFSGAVNVDATTDSTSATSGALIVDGGLGVAKNVYIGAGLSVAGTLTYEDVTNVDSVGLITAKSGVNITGGQLQVGVAYSVGAAGVCTAAGFVGPLTGNVTGNSATATEATNVTAVSNASNTAYRVPFLSADTGTAAVYTDTNSGITYNPSTNLLSSGSIEATITTAAQTNITSLGSLSSLAVTGTTTLNDDLVLAGASYNVSWDKSANYLQFADNAKAVYGAGADLQLYHDGSHSYVSNTTGTLYIQAKSGENAITAVPDGEVYVAYNNSTKLSTTNDGVSITGMTTTSAGMTFNGMLKEEVNIVANKLSAGTNVDVADGMVHYYSTNETTTATPNIRFNSSYTLNNKMAIGQTISVTIIYKPNGAGYYAGLNIDGNGVTEEWLGGSAPSSANAGGYDILTHTLVKTANATFLCLSNVQNFA